MRYILIAAVVINLVAPSIAGALTGCQITLAWDANEEPDLAGYKIYWGRDSRSYTNTIEILCRANDVSCCEVTIGDLELGKYYFAATAFDDDDNESNYSEELDHTFTSCNEKATPMKSPSNFHKKETI
jgi:hypothetical protein